MKRELIRQKDGRHFAKIFLSMSRDMNVTGCPLQISQAHISPYIQFESNKVELRTNQRQFKARLTILRPFKPQEPGRRTRLLGGGEWNAFLAGSVSLCFRFLMAQESTSLLSCIYNNDCQQCRHSCNKKHFHAHRIARSRRPVLYREFADTKQLWKHR